MRPYLVIPKLIEQPTWGGTYIVETKAWQDMPGLSGRKIGQSYELYEKSNLSLITDTRDPKFTGELSDNKSVETQSTVPNSVSISSLISEGPEAVLGARIVSSYGAVMPLLLKFTQALGNSFQLHIPDGMKHPKWKAKPESWYYFEPGLITCGVRKGVDWDAYKSAVTALDAKMQEISAAVRANTMSFEQAKRDIAGLIKTYDPLQYVNTVRVPKDTLIDLSPCGIHHSWEEDLNSIPLGNVLYEIQLNRMDDESTIRAYDKGKMKPDGTLRPLQIDEYFEFADRSNEANDPQTHMRKPRLVRKDGGITYERILETKYYSMDRVRMQGTAGDFSESIDTFRHVFVRAGSVTLTSGGHTLAVTAGHSAFVPASCRTYVIRPRDAVTELLISY